MHFTRKSVTLSALLFFGCMAQSSTVLVVQEGPGKVMAFDADKPEIRSDIPVGNMPHEIVVSVKGQTAYVSNFGLLEVNHKIGVAGKTISVIDVAHARERQRFQLPGDLAAPHGLKLRPPAESELFTNAEVGEAMIVFDASSGAVKRTFPLPPKVHNFIFSADGAALFAFSTTGEISRLDPATGKVEARHQSASPRGLAFTADRSALIVSGIGELELLNPRDLTVLKRYSHLGVRQIFYPAASLDGRFLFAPAVLDGVVLVIDASTGGVLHRVATGSPLLLVPAGPNTIWISNVLVPPAMLPPGVPHRPGSVTRLDLNTFESTDVPGIVDANGLAVSPVRLSRPPL